MCFFISKKSQTESVVIVYMDEEFMKVLVAGTMAMRLKKITESVSLIWDIGSVLYYSKHSHV